MALPLVDMSVKASKKKQANRAGSRCYREPKSRDCQGAARGNKNDVDCGQQRHRSRVGRTELLGWVIRYTKALK